MRNFLVPPYQISETKTNFPAPVPKIMWMTERSSALTPANFCGRFSHIRPETISESTDTSSEMLTVLQVQPFLKAADLV